MPASEQTITLLSVFSEAVRDLGEKQVVAVLQNARCKTVTIKDPNVDFVLKMVANHYKLQVDEMLYGSSRSGKRKLALCFSLFYLHKVFSYSFGELRFLFKKHKSQLSRWNKMIESGLADKASGIFSQKERFDLAINSYNNIKNRQ